MPQEVINDIPRAYQCIWDASLTLDQKDPAEAAFKTCEYWLNKNAKTDIHLNKALESRFLSAARSLLNQYDELQTEFFMASYPVPEDARYLFDERLRDLLMSEDTDARIFGEFSMKARSIDKLDALIKKQEENKLIDFSGNAQDKNSGARQLR